MNRINFDKLDHYYEVLTKDVAPNALSTGIKDAVISGAAAMIILKEIEKAYPEVHNTYYRALVRLQKNGGNKTKKIKRRHRKKSLRHRKKSLMSY